MYTHNVENELRRRLFQQHMTYLNLDDTPEKLVKKTKLEGLILEYLSLVSHRKKFDSVEVADSFDKSIISKNDFNACRAAIAFEALEKYANNLLTKPWRKEFRLINPHGECIRNLINKELIGASNILYSMGYRLRRVNYVSVYALDTCVMDPDNLARLSLDCLIAFVECQMMIQISDALKKKNIPISWLQILDIRANSVCSMDQVVNFVIDSNQIHKLVDLTSRCSIQSNMPN